MSYFSDKYTKGQFFAAIFTDPNGIPDHNRIIIVGSFVVVCLYAPVSLLKVKLGIEYMPDTLLGVFTSIILAGLGFTSRETVNKINQDKPEAPAAINIATTKSGDANNVESSPFIPN